jgi:predicted alpha/beta hydrolase
MFNLMAEREEITIAADDGFALAGTLVRPDGPPRAAVLITSGTGFPRTYYLRLARELAERGCAVMVFDCRGIGGSAPADLGAMRMTYADWGRLDTPAALDALAKAAPGAPLLHIAHSVGGHFIGLWRNQAAVAAHLFLCVGSGYWRDHFARAWPLELYFWLVYGPWSLRRHGYVRHGGGWQGASLPRGVWEPWRRWCLKPGYFHDELGSPASGLHPNGYAGVVAPIRSIVYSDDPIANARTAPVMLDLYPNATRELRVRRPQEFGLNRIGHNGPFSTAASPARADIWAWLEDALARQR